MAYEKIQPIDSLKEGDRVEDVFVVKIKKGFKQYAKGYSFQLILTDNSGRTIDYRFWGGLDEAGVKALYDSILADSVVLVQGKVAKYMDKLQISTNDPDTITALSEGDYNPEDFIMASRLDADEMYKLLETYMENVEDPDLSELLRHIFKDDDFREKFIKHPGAIEIHHNWVGGLLQHTLEVVEYSLMSKRMFPELDEDYLTAGAILHDIGKLDELEVTSRIKGSRIGQLHGHIALGYALLSKIMDELQTSTIVREKLLHIIISHHGKLEYGSPKPPMMPEAYAVYYADEMSSKLSEITEYIKWAKESTDDDFMYHRRHGHNILLD